MTLCGTKTAELSVHPLGFKRVIKQCTAMLAFASCEDTDTHADKDIYYNQHSLLSDRHFCVS